MKVPAPSVFEEEMLNLFNKAWDVFPEPNVDGLDDATADAILEANYQKVHDYVQEHRSLLLAEFCEYYSGRDGDEGQLRDKDGSFLISEQGYPIQGWEITSDHRIVDRNGKQLFYSDGEPILAKQMSVELFNFLKKNWDAFEDATEESRWF